MSTATITPAAELEDIRAELDLGERDGRAAGARDTVRDLLAKHPPGLVVMILRELKTILRATKDITIYAPTEGKQTHENQNTPHP